MSRVTFRKSVSRLCVAFGLVALTGFFAMGCLGLDSHKRQPDKGTDTEPQTCAGISCWEPDPNTCAASGQLKVVAPSGYCSGGDCFYATRQEECRAGICDGGVCVSTPCQGVTCIDPPLAFCSEADRTIYAPSGYCTGGKCKYASRTSPCEEACAAGACVESPCNEVFCLKPPAPYCENDSNLIVFSPEGRCAVVGSSAQCRYDSQPLPCDHGCEGGRCQNDPCAGVRCNTPPARYCDDAEVVLFEPYGVCNEDGFCVYAEQRHACIQPCWDASCGEDDACTWVTCNKPPASYCKDDAALRVYGRDGWCKEGFCSYVYSDITCSEGCQDGRCVGDTGDSAKEITQFSVRGINGTIDEANEQISLTLPVGTGLTSLTPTIIHTGAGISPPSGVLTDFSNPVEYTVTAVDSSTKVYVANVTVASAAAWHEHDVRGSYLDLNWITAIALSSDGTKLAVTEISSASSDGYIFTSTDSGATWTPVISAGKRYWMSIASSSDGTKLAAAAVGDYIYTSTDSGVTWTRQTAAGLEAWWNISSSHDGTKLAAVAGIDYMYIHTSTDSGVTWTRQTSAGSRVWNSIASSSDGTRLAAAASDDYIYTSTDSGVTWTQQTSAGRRLWFGITSSSDGTKLAAAPSGDTIYTSTDSGVTWTQQASAGNRTWNSIASSSDSTKLAAVAVNDTIYTSTDSGVTWTQQTSAGSRSWWCIASSSDGFTFAAGVRYSPSLFIFK